jgi:hypothetical protein
MINYDDQEVLLRRIEQQHTLFRDGVIGTKEFRNWLAKVDQVFGEVRDSDVDNEIDELARQRSEDRREDRYQAQVEKVAGELEGI